MPNEASPPSRPGPPTRRRALSAVLADLEQLRQDELDRVWAHVSAPPAGQRGGGPRWVVQAGSNAQSLYALWDGLRGRSTVTIPPALRRLIVGLWCQDNPAALVRPAWCPGLDVRGDVGLN